MLLMASPAFTRPPHVLSKQSKQNSTKYILVVERHHCNFDRVAEKENQVAEDGGRSIEFAFSDAPRRVHNKENVLGAIRSATGLAPVAVSMLRNVELRWLEGEWLGFGC